jgi:sugar fermentation stimulation protein A
VIYYYHIGYTAMEQLHSITHADGLISGTIVERSNRFVVRVQFDAAPERVYLADPGELEGIVEPGHDMLCLPVGDPDRATDYDAISVQINDVHVSVRTALANDLFESAIKIEAIPAFHEYEIRHREPSFPEHG